MTIAQLQAEGLAQHIEVAGVTVTCSTGATVRISLTAVRDEPRGEYWMQGMANANSEDSWYWRSATELLEGERITTATGRKLIVSASKPIEFGDAVAYYVGTLLETFGEVV